MARRTDPTDPQLDPVRLDGLDPTGIDVLERGADLEGLDIVGTAEDGELTAPSLSLSVSRLAGIRGAVTLRDVRLAEVRLEQLDTPVFSAPGATWRDVELESSRLGSAELYEAEWHGVRVTGCRLGYLNLRGAELRDVLFEDCTIDELDLVQATATRLAFRGCDIRRLDVQQATLQHVDLRGAELRELSGVGNLRGAVVSPAQLADLAPLLADHLGLTIR